MFSFELQWRTMSESLDKPEVIVVLDELADHRSGLFDRLEAMDVKDLLLQGSVETLDDAVALGTPDECRRGDKPQELELGLEIG